MTGRDERQSDTNAGVGRGAALTVVGVVAVVAVMVAIAVSTLPQPADESSSATAGASASEASVALQPSEAATGSPAESSAATEAPGPSSPPVPFDQWAQVAAFGTDGYAEEVDGMAYAAGNFIAIGHREPLTARGSVGPPQDTPLVWSSPDGRTWSRVALDESFANAHLQTVVALPGGDALIYGGGTAWRSADGVSWEKVELALPGDSLDFVVAGGRGYASLVSRSDSTESVTEIWHSADGTGWQVSDLQLSTPIDTSDPAAGQDFITVRDLAAGDEGFVAAAQFGDWEGDQRTDTPMVFASADGLEWIEAPESELPAEPALLVAALGSDWVLTATDFNTGDTTIWWSANGLAWEQRTSVEVALPAEADVPELDASAIVGDIIGAGRGVILSGVVQVCCHSPWWAAGVWSSVDAHQWERLDLPADAVVTNAADHDGVTVLGGHTGATPDAQWKAVATFWVNDGQ